ncbi:MAG: hypothetical protein GY757_09165 [bacterium]|nr:hypothetical protein [bacterium]
MKNPPSEELAFVLPMADKASRDSTGYVQDVNDRFAVIVALRNDNCADKTGIETYDRLDQIRADICFILVGWEMGHAESSLFYAGGHLLDFNRANLWYQFEFEYSNKLVVNTEGHGEFLQRDVVDLFPGETLPEFERIFTQYAKEGKNLKELLEAADLPVDVSDPNIEDYIIMQQTVEGEKQ